MSVYQCLICRAFYGLHKELPHLKPVDWDKSARYMDCTIWKCPHCNTQQDSRDYHGGMFGERGSGTSRVLNTEDIEHELLNPMPYENPKHLYQLQQRRNYARPRR